MKKIAFAFVCLFAAIAAPIITYAHPGHGTSDGYTIIHYFTEPSHIIMLVAVVLVSVGISHYADKKNQQSNN